MLEKRLANEVQAEEEARVLSLADRKELQAHLDSMAAGAIFRMLDPTYCPPCDTEISEAKKKLENSNSLQAQIGVATAKLGSYHRQQDLDREIAVLEGRLAEAKRDVSQGGADHQPDEMKALGAIVTETDNRVRAVRDDLLKDVSTRIVHYAQRFGMHTLTGASLKANAVLSLVKGGTNTFYSKVTEGEKLRLKVATVLAMLEIGEQRCRPPSWLVDDRLSRRSGGLSGGP
jgi:hypothetical protein